MPTAVKLIFWKKVKNIEEIERRELVEEIERTKQYLHQAHLSFNNVCDSDLIESCVVEINALQARYNFLLRTLKETARK